MGNAIGQFLSHAVGVAISPLALIAVILILGAPRGRANAVAFALGWLVAVAAVFGIILIIGADAGAHRNTGQPATWVSWFRLILGILLGLMTVRQLRMVSKAEEGLLPKRFRNVEQFTTGNSLALGVVLAVANPKNVMQIATGAVTVASNVTHHGKQVGSAAIFLAIASAGVLVPLLIAIIGHASAPATLERWKQWTIRNHYGIMAVLFALLAAKSLGDGISGLWP
jgi:hypothetical protein